MNVFIGLGMKEKIMKPRSFLSLLTLSLISAAAYAGTVIPLHAPVPPPYLHDTCHFVNQNIVGVQGFSASGEYILGLAKGYTACGSVGSKYEYWCAALKWDLEGNLVSEVPASVPYGSKCQPDTTKTFTNSGGYVAYTKITTICTYGCVLHYQAELKVP
jgi:hypothetical protein